MNAGRWLMALLACVAFAAQAQTERERIAADRAAATARFAERERECRAQFVVTACVEAAQRDEHDALKRLRRQEQALNDTERRDAAARRRAGLAERAAAQAVRDGADKADSAPTREQARRSPPAARAASASDAGEASRPRVTPPLAEPHVDEKRNEASFKAKKRTAQEHREAIERRNAERAAHGKVAAPLPVPKGASAP